MKIRIEKNDIENVLKAFCPAVKCNDGKFELNIKGKTIAVRDAELALKSRIAYDTVSGDLDLKMDRDGVDAEVKLD
jgi:hypothetical protein